MEIELANRDISGVLIAYVKFKSQSFFCMAPVEYWIGASWFMYIEQSKGTLESQYFNFLKRFRLDYHKLCLAYAELNLKDDFEREGNIPCIYIDFNKKYFASYFQEQDLEDRVPENWISEYKTIVDLIPVKYRYWEFNKNNEPEV